MRGNREVSMVVLAGGTSSRMGSDKSDLLLGDSTFLESQIEKGRRLGMEDILVSGYRGKSCSAKIVKDRMPEKGPLGGMESCFRAAKHERCLVISVDMPFVPERVLEELIEQSFLVNSQIVALQHGERQEPLIGVYHKDMADDILKKITIGEGSVFAFLRQKSCIWHHVAAAEECFVNINDPNAYQMWVMCRNRKK